MRQSVLTRFILFGIATLATLIYLVPTFFQPLPDWWTSFLPSDKIHLGLDLQGGSHLVLEVKVDKAVENNIERVKAISSTVFARKEFPAHRWNASKAPNSTLKCRRPAPNGCAAY